MNFTEINFKKQAISETESLNNAFISRGQMGKIEVIAYQSAAFECVVSIQGAQLLHWKPATQANIIFTSPKANFSKGCPIRGGVPICWPWFGKNATPAHGFARIEDWKVVDLQADALQLRLVLHLSSEHLSELIKTVLKTHSPAYLNQPFILSLVLEINSKTCDLALSFSSNSAAFESVSAALHTYFEIADIQAMSLFNAGKVCLNTLNDRMENVPDPRNFDQKVDCIYEAGADLVDSDVQNHKLHRREMVIKDIRNQREINIIHEASDIVVWNPWEAMSDMSFAASQQMLCVESAYLREAMTPNRVLRQTISYRHC